MLPITPTVNKQGSRNGLKETTQSVYDFIEKYMQEEGYAPSLEEIGGAHCYLALSTVLRHLDKLEAKGLIARTPGRSRSLRITKE